MTGGMFQDWLRQQKENERRHKQQVKVQAEALAAEATAAYNLGLIRKLERKVEALKSITGALSELITSTADLLRAEDELLADGLEIRIAHLEGAVFDEGPPVTREDVGI